MPQGYYEKQKLINKLELAGYKGFYSFEPFSPEIQSLEKMSLPASCATAFNIYRRFAYDRQNHRRRHRRWTNWENSCFEHRILHARSPGKNYRRCESYAGNRSMGKNLGIPHVTNNAEDIFGDPEISVVQICSSTDTHADYIIKAARSGKNIFCEKPVDLSVEKVKKALAAVKEAGVRLQIGFNRRFDHNFAHVRKLIDDGAIGQVQLVKITSRDPAPPPISYVKVSGGIFLDMTIHDFDMARFQAKSEVEEVYAQGAVLIDPEIGKAGDVDTAIIMLKFANGALGVIDNSRKAVYGYDQRVEVFGSAGAAAAENDTPSQVRLSDTSGVHADKPLLFLPRALQRCLY